MSMFLQRTSFPLKYKSRKTGGEVFSPPFSLQGLFDVDNPCRFFLGFFPLGNAHGKNAILVAG